MKKLSIYLIGIIILSQSCSEPIPDARQRWGQFNPGELIKYEEIDYTSTPVYRHISDDNGLLPEYKYMNDVVVYGIGYIS
ncbi:MAG: hypothetical protein JKX73_05985, partial [Flavobacteriales bacterium]|nr:hypothetical protein [Flavobacteriales bacterium]